MSLKIIDIEESYDGDLVLNAGDIKTTHDKPEKGAYQIVRKLLSTKRGESDAIVNLGFDADSFEGKVNDQRTAKLLEKTIKSSLLNNTIFFGNEISVNAFPISKSSLGVKVILNSIDTSKKGMVISYDTMDNRIKSVAVNEV